MALETFLDSEFQMAARSVALNRVTGGFVRSPSSDILLQKDEQYRAVVASLLNASSGNLPNAMPMIAHMNVGRVSGDMNPTALNHAANGSSFRGNSLVTGWKPELSKGPHLHRSTSTSTSAGSNLEFPTLPASFSSPNLGISGSSSVIDGSSIAQQTSHLGQNSQQANNKRKNQQGDFNAASQVHHSSLPNVMKQESLTSIQMHKKPRIDIKQEAILHHHIIQQLLKNPDSSQLQGRMPQLQALFQQHQLQNQKLQRICQSIPQFQGVDMQQQQQQQMKQNLQEPVVHQVSAMQPFNEGVCSRRLMQHIYHLRQRPSDNDIAYWRKFVAEYYAPCARKRWCLSLHDKVGLQTCGILPQAATDAWQCDLCGCKSGRGFEAVFEVLPRLNKIAFESVIDELLFLDLPHESRFPSGLMMLEYGKAVQESIYEQLRVVREGQLRILFTRDLKILSWEFCSRRHEELYPRSLVAPQVNQLVLAAQKNQSTNDGSGSGGVSLQDLQANYDTFLAAGCQLAKNLELRLVDNLGFSKRYSRCLQIAEIVYSMKDLMTFCQDNNKGPIESLKNYSHETTSTKVQKEELQEKEGLGSSPDLPTDKNKLMATSTGLTSNMNDSSNVTNRGILTSSEQAALTLPGHYHKLLRQNSSTSDVSRVQQEHSSSDMSNQTASFKPYKGKTSSPGLIKNSPINGLSSSSSHSSEGTQNMTDQTIQKILQEMVKNSRKVSGDAGDRVICEVGKSTVTDLPTRVRGIDVVQDGLSSENSVAAVALPGNTLGSTMERRISSSGSVYNRESSGFCGNNSFIKKQEHLVSEKLHLPKGLLNMIHEYHGNGMFSGNNNDDMRYEWRA